MYRTVMSPQQALSRYVEHVCTIRERFDVQVSLARCAAAQTNGWTIRARVRPPVSIKAFESTDGRWVVTASVNRRSHTVVSAALAPADLLEAIGTAVKHFVDAP